MRNKIKSLNTFPPPCPSNQAQLLSKFLYLLIPEWHRKMGNGGCDQVLFLPLLPPRSLLLLQRGVPLPRETVLQELLQSESFPQAAVLHELLRSGSFPRSAILQEQNAPAWVLQEVTSPASKPARVWASLFPRVHRSFQGPAPVQALHNVTISFGHIHLILCAVIHTLQVDICSTVNLHGLKGHSLTHHGLHHGLQGNVCSGVSSTSSPSSFTDLGVCRAVSLT